jgi:uncharacterized protein YpbB
MSLPKSIKRYTGPRPPGPNAILGTYIAGIKNEKFAARLGQTVATWVHVEDLMIQVLQDLLGSKQAPARQIFHSVRSNEARKKLMTDCLQKARTNERKTDLYENIISQFSKLNRKRNTLLHGLWYTHESGRVFLSESALDDFHYADAREVDIEELEDMNKAIAVLVSTITHRRSPSLARTISSPHELPKQSLRQNKKEYRRSKGTAGLSSG